MTMLSKITVSSIALMAVVSTVSAVDQVAAAAELANIATLSVQSKANLSEAALGGDVDAIAEATKRADAVDVSMAQAQEAYSAMERAVASGDEDAAQSAADDLKTAVENAINALSGIIPDEVISAVNQLKANVIAGGPGRPGVPPNMYDIPWNSDQMRSFYTAQFANLWGSATTPFDSEATPE